MLAHGDAIAFLFRDFIVDFQRDAVALHFLVGHGGESSEDGLQPSGEERGVPLHVVAAIMTDGFQFCERERFPLASHAGLRKWHHIEIGKCLGVHRQGQRQGQRQEQSQDGLFHSKHFLMDIFANLGIIQQFRANKIKIFYSHGIFLQSRGDGVLMCRHVGISMCRHVGISIYRYIDISTHRHIDTTSPRRKKPHFWRFYSIF